ncbi:MAG: glycosyltransferase family 4 protein [Nitrosospira sp.]
MPEVVLLSHGFQPEYEAGFTNGLARNGVRVILIGSDTTLRHRIEPSVEIINLRRSQDPNRAVWKKMLNIIRYWCNYFAFLLRHRGVPVHVIGMFSTKQLWVSLIEAWLTKWASGGYILTVHNLLPHDRQTAINAWLSYCIYRSTAYLMVHTHRMQQDLCRDFQVDPGRVVVVEHGIDKLLPDTGGERQMMRNKLAINASERVVLFFGSIARYKGVDILLRAFELPGSQSADRLVVAGKCRDRVLALELQTLVETNARRDAILWRDGFVDENDVAPLFHAADVLVMPYRHIDQSGVIFMALAIGLRVVVTDVGSLRNYVRHGFGAIAPIEDPEALAACIKEVLASATGNPVDYGAERYLWQRTVTPILPFYNRK